MKIIVTGIGYVGLSNAVMLAQYNDVVITDIVGQKVDMVNARVSPIEDRDIRRFFSEKQLSLKAALANNCDYSEFDCVIVAVSTDYDDDAAGFNTLSVENITDAVISSGSNAIIVIRSTVPIGFTACLNARCGTDRIIFAPEFLREGKALYDALNPSRIVVGGTQEYAETFARLLADSADKRDIDILLTKSSEAESIKLFSNAYLAMRVAFINEIDTFALMKSLDSGKIIEGVCLDPRIGSGYNNPSFGYGGYCLPKDTRQLKSSFESIPGNIISAIVDANESRKRFIADALLNGNAGTIGIYRLAMKSGSDNFRDSSVVHVLKKLVEAGRRIIVYEPLLKEAVFEGCVVVRNLKSFKLTADIIVANRIDDELNDVGEKVYTRDIFERD
jgi:UDPglucose 6-dehydrogenase